LSSAVAAALPAADRAGRRKDKGEASRPTKVAREKLRVARVERAVPRRRRERDERRAYSCWGVVVVVVVVVVGVVGVPFLRRWVSRKGRRVVRAVVTARRAGRVWRWFVSGCVLSGGWGGGGGDKEEVR
jgi:hypothetical protein